jgi:hypothetical protein
MARAVYVVSFPCGSITMIAVFEQSGVSRSWAHSCRRKAQKFPRDELQQNRAAFVDRLHARLFGHVKEILFQDCCVTERSRMILMTGAEIALVPYSAFFVRAGRMMIDQIMQLVHTILLRWMSQQLVLTDLRFSSRALAT